MKISTTIPATNTISVKIAKTSIQKTANVLCIESTNSIVANSVRCLDFANTHLTDAMRMNSVCKYDENGNRMKDENGNTIYDEIPVYKEFSENDLKFIYEKLLPFVQAIATTFVDED